MQTPPMHIHRDWTGVPASARGASVAMGNFDGIHLGHRAVLDAARNARPDAPLGVVTFEPHPREVFSPDSPPFRLMDATARANRLARLGVSDAFDIFVLSDSTKEDAAAAERSVFQAFRMAANSKAFYRRRTDNAERKAGNLAEWVRRFGAAYETMIVLDADSTMAGETLLRMVDAMQFHEEHGDVCPAQWEKGKAGMGASPDGVAKYLTENADQL